MEKFLEEKPFPYFLYVFLPTLFIFTLIVLYLYYADVALRKRLVKESELNTVENAKEIFISNVQRRIADVRYVVQRKNVQRWVENPNEENMERITNEFFTYIQSYPEYDQLRLFDALGKEVVRVDAGIDRPIVVPKERLQDKASRYYIKELLRFDKEDVYLSPIDLNVEYGQIEKPIKPVLRVGIPLYASNGALRGAIVLNYLVRHLLDRLNALHESDERQMWLLNSEGYWLMGPEKSKEWTFMFPEQQDISFRSRFPQLWPQLIAGKENNQFLFLDNMLTYVRFGARSAEEKSYSKVWILATFVSREYFRVLIAPKVRQLTVTYVIFVFILVVSSWSLSRKDRLRRESQRLLWERERQYRSLLNSAPDAIVIVNAKGIIQLVNEEAEKRFGYTRDELIGESIEALVPDTIRDAHKGLRDNYIKAPSIRPMGANAELSARRKDGSEFPVEISLSPSRGSGELFITSIIRDVSERKRSEQIFRQEQDRYRKLVTHIPMAIFRLSTGPQHEIKDANPAMLLLFGANTIEELTATSFEKRFADSEALKKLFNHLAANGLVNSYEVEMVTLSGTHFYAAITAIVMQEGNDGIYINSIVENISERREQEIRIKSLNRELLVRQSELENVNKELEAFSYSVSHDLRAPLRAVDGFSQTLLKNYANVLDEKGLDRLNRIRSGAQRMAQLIDDLLMLSRISRHEIKWENVDLGKMSQEILRDLVDGDADNVPLHVNIQDDLLASGDRHLLKIAMTNLLSNAYKFTSRTDQREINVGMQKQDERNVYFVKDNGAGFSMEYADKLFGAFQRLHDTREFPGTGIGLATVQRIIHKHGGTVWAEAEVGKGATFSFTLSR